MDKQFVSTTVFVNLQGMPWVQLQTRNGLTEKCDVSINDDSGVMKLTIWGSKKFEVSASGVYKIANAVVNEYPKNAFSLQTGFKTTFILSEQDITPTKTNLPELCSYQVSLPPQSAKVTKNIICPTCQSITQL